MARGWESKSVEDQIGAAEAAKEARNKPRLSIHDLERRRRLESLLLSRSQIVARLKVVTNARYRGQLKSALSDVEREVESLKSSA